MAFETSYPILYVLLLTTQSNIHAITVLTFLKGTTSELAGWFYALYPFNAER